MSDSHNSLPPLPVVIDASTSPSTDNDKPMLLPHPDGSALSNWGFGLRLASIVLCVVLILLVILAIVVTLVLVR